MIIFFLLLQIARIMSKKICNVYKKEDGYYEYSEQYRQFLRLFRFDAWFKTFPNIDFSLVIYNELNEIGYCWDETQEVDRLVELKKHDFNFFFKTFYLTSK